MSRVASGYVYSPVRSRKQRTYTKIDFVKTKFLFRLLFLVAFMAILSLFYIWSRVQIVQKGYEINKLRVMNVSLQEENKKLIVELATLKSPTRIEEIAKEKLKMDSPTKNQIKMIP